MPTEREKMLAGAAYDPGDAELVALRDRARALLDRFHALPLAAGRAARMAVLGELLGAVGEGAAILPRFVCDYGFNIAIGARSFVNYDAVMLDVCAIEIGADVQIAPRVQLLTADHPLEAAPRRAGVESGRPVRIGDGVWLGAGVIVLPGVTIGENTVVGAGAVVTRDLPAGVLAVGNPARVVRALG
jgi:maltose O-acetyltransferase